MKIVFFTFYYPPDLCAGSFRAVALTEALSQKLAPEDEIHIITTHPNRYASHTVEAEDDVVEGNVRIHRIHVPGHMSGMVSQALTFFSFAWHALRYCIKIRPDFIIGTSSRLMTGVLTWLSATLVRCRYFIDLRDIFSETISDVFAMKSRLLGRVAKFVFSFFEKLVFRNASGVNVVSMGFPEYFESQGLQTNQWTFFPNGVDREFTDLFRKKRLNQDDVITILYAGNIGSGQGLEIIVPDVAKRLGNQYRFKIIGDGGTRRILRQRIDAEGLNNVELLPPVGRDKLIQYYDQSDILFLHLNNLPAFKRVLPSKIFEYAALGKPVVAGLGGYSAQFVRNHIDYGCVFSPGDVDACVSCIQEASERNIEQEAVEGFVKKFSRVQIMDDMSNHILSVIAGKSADAG